MRALKREDKQQFAVVQGEKLNRDHVLDMIEITRDPRDMLARFFLKAVSAAAARDITLEFGSFDELLAVNEANSDTWKPITTSFHPKLSGVDQDNGLVVFGRNGQGEIVATQATRYFVSGARTPSFPR